MRSSRTITLFSDRPDAGPQSSSFLFSLLAHGVAIGLVSLGVIYSPKMNNHLVAEHYTVRHLDLHMPDAQKRKKPAGRIAYPKMPAGMRKPSPGGKPVTETAQMRKTAPAAPGPQTLVQPDVHTKLKLNKETPVPTVVIWSPAKAPVKTIVPPTPQKPTAADARPSIEPPNEEVNLADIGIAATGLSQKTPLVLPSTTSPVVVHGPEALQMPPVTTSVSTAQPTPTAIMSISDLKMPEGTVTLPPVNQTVAKESPGGLAPGQAKDDSQAGKGNPDSKAGGAGAGAGDKGDKPDAAGKPAAAGKPEGEKAGDSQVADAGAGTGNQPSAEKITLPKDGQFGAVVIGDSLEDRYPETAGLMGGRLAYTVYLHVGLAKNWILQYSLPRSVDAAAGGNVTRLEAPWPYNVVRPNITAGAINADALMVHGFVNQAGRFEGLAIAFPQEFPQAQFVLSSLAQWQFRAATQGGQSVRVEVLLIIPEESE